jgi:sirohydrochlorin cobaltochelatase
MDTSSNSENKTGILLIGHGSRLPYNKQVVRAIAEKYAKTQPDYTVEVGFMELAQPDIPTAFNKLKETGVNRIIVTPVFLAHGMHTKRDIPTILGIEPADIEKELEDYEKQQEEHHSHEEHDHEEGHCHGHAHGHGHGHGHHHHHGELETVEFDGEIIYTEPIGADDAIVDIIAERVNSNL